VSECSAVPCGGGRLQNMQSRPAVASPSHAHSKESSRQCPQKRCTSAVNVMVPVSE
jgi:hypothetical protein